MDDAESMQPLDATPPAPSQGPPISMVDSDLHTDNALHHDHAVPTKSPARDTMDTMARISTGLVVGAILLAMFGVMSDAWAVQEESETVEMFGTEITTKMELETGLDDVSVTICVDDECETTNDDLSSAYDNCTSTAKELEYNKSQQEELCGDLGKTASAGLAGMVLISIGIIVMLVILVTTFMELRGTAIPYSQHYPFAAAVFVLLGVAVWYLMLPEGDASLGVGAWMAIASAVLAATAGGYPMYCGENTVRSPGIGVRALTAESEAREFVLRENAMGTKSTSLVEQGKVLRLVYAKLENENVVTEDQFIVQKAALTGFTHHRYDWLDNGKYIWWLMTGVGIISLFISPAIGSSVLLIGTLLSLAQLFDPELLSFETNAGRHRLLLYRQDSNRELTNFSMDEIDSNMQQLLSGEQLDGSSVETKAAEIEEKRAAEIKAQQEAAAALELAKVAAAAQPTISQIPPPPAPTGAFTEPQSLPPPLPLPSQVQSLPPPPMPLIDEPLLPPPPSLLDEPLLPPPPSLLDEPLPPPPPSW